MKEKLTAQLNEYLKIDKAHNRQIRILHGGLGDFVALDCLMSEKEKNEFDTVYQVGYRPPMYESLFLNYHQVKTYRYFWDCLESKEKTWECRNHLINQAKDSIKVLNFNWRQRYYTESTFIKNEMANISKFNLPGSFFVVCPYTINATEKWINRKISDRNWQNVISILDNTQRIFCVNLGIKCECPQHEKIIDLSDKTNILEAFEITKKSIFYIGVDSVLSVISALQHPTLVMSKKHTGVAWKLRDFYYPRGVKLVENITTKDINQISRICILK